MNQIANLVGQQSISTSTGTFALNSVNGQQTFAGAFGISPSDTFFYFISSTAAPEWEVGIGYLTDSATLIRSEVLDSSNAGSLVNFSAGTKNVINDVPASYQELLVQPAFRIVTSGGTVTLDPTDGVIWIKQTVGAPINVSVNPALLPVGRKYTIKDAKGDAASNNITITPVSGSCDGAGTFVLRYAYQALTFCTDGTNLGGVA